MKRLLDKDNVQIVILTLLSIVCIILFIQMLGRANREGGYDFTSYLISAKALLNNNNPYITDSPFPYIYPLFLASILIPFTFLPYNINNIFWFFVNVGSLCFILYLLLKQFYNDNPSKKIFLFLLLIVVITIFNPIQNNLLNGQVNFLVILFCTLFFYYDNKNNILSSLFLALAISLKLVPLIFLLFLIIEKKYLNIASVLFFSFLFIFIFPYLFTGIRILDYYSYYLNNFLLNSFSTSVYHPKSIFFTVNGFITNTFFISNSFNFFLVIFCISIILVAIIFSHVYLLKKKVPQRKLFLFALFSLAILLISPSSQTHHLIFLIPSIFLIIINFFEGIDKEKRLFIFYYTSFFILFWLGSIYKHSPFIFLSIMTLFIIIMFSKNKIRLSNEKI